MPRLIVLQGPDLGKVFSVDRNLTIGRLSSNDIQLLDEQTSRQHARLEFGSAGVVAVDLGSRKGIEVNGRKVDRQRLTHGDSLAIGTTVLRFEDAENGAPPALPAEPEAASPGRPAGFRVNPPAELDAERRPTAPPPPPRRASARPAAVAEPAPAADARRVRRSTAPASPAATALKLLLGIVILVLVFFASKWAGYAAVQRVLRDLSSRPGGK